MAEDTPLTEDPKQLEEPPTFGWDQPKLAGLVGRELSLNLQLLRAVVQAFEARYGCDRLTHGEFPEEEDHFFSATNTLISALLVSVSWLENHHRPSQVIPVDPLLAYQLMSSRACFDDWKTAVPWVDVKIENVELRMHVEPLDKEVSIKN